MSKRLVHPAQLAGIRAWLGKRFRCFGGFVSYTPDFSGKETDCLFIPDELSAKMTWSRETRELLLLGIATAFIIFGAILWYAGIRALASVLSLLGGLFYLVTVYFRLYLSCVSFFWIAKKRNNEEERAEVAAPKEEYPVYSVLVPLRREVGAIPGLVKAMQELDWPAEKLDVRFVVDKDDEETIAALRKCGPPKTFRIVIVKRDARVRSKPRALNAALCTAKGEFITIYDAEDRPEKDQLKKAYTLFRKHPEILCCQARLDYYNEKRNILTRWFAAEYLAWFRYTLPAVAENGLPVPLGGTSNHFRMSALLNIGGWDSYNVTEDCDLGLRLYRMKGPNAVRMLDSTTYEEAPVELGNWLRQRSRWIKGFFQTFLVHARYPVQAAHDFGMRGFLGFFFFTFCGSVVHLVNIGFWTLFILWLCGSNSFIAPFFPQWVRGLHFFALVTGNISLILVYVFAALRERRYATAFAAVAVPLYWGLMAVASVKAFAQLFICPHYWEKTHHAGEEKN